MKRLICLLLILLLPITALGEEVTLRIAGGWNGNYEEFCKKYPNVAVEYTEDDSFSANGIINALVTRDATYDIMRVNTSGVDVAKIIDQGYALPMEGNDAIAAYVNSLYPALKDMVTRDGHIYAVPLFLFSNDGGYYPQNFETLGLEVPTTWEELAALINAWPDQPEDVREDYEINEWTENYRSWFLNKVTERYVVHMEATGQELHFDTPLYRDLVALVDTMTTENDMEERDVMALMGNGYIEPFQEGYTWQTPMLDLAIEGRVTHNVIVELLLLNPYTEHAEEALQCVSFMIDQIKPQIRQTMVDAAFVTPVEDPEYALRMAAWEAKRDRLAQKLAECDEADRLDVQEEIDQHEKSLEWIEASRWLISAESIPAYAEVFETLYFPKPSVLDAKDGNDPYANSIADTLRARYIDGQIDMDTYIREMESRIQMVLMERGE